MDDLEDIVEAVVDIEDIVEEVAEPAELIEDFVESPLLIALALGAVLAAAVTVLLVLATILFVLFAGPVLVVGFLAMSTLVSIGAIPSAMADGLAATGVLATASAMAAIGFGVDVRVLRTSGRAAVLAGTVGFILLFAAMTGYYAIVAT